jgi:hypothetical protein
MDLREALTEPERLLFEREMFVWLAALTTATFLLTTALAQQNASPSVGLEQCSRPLESCRAECRARIFAIDPRRDVCLKECAEAKLRCAQPPDPEAQVAPGSASRPFWMKRR